ncbi:hypothetical protein [Chloracidobacterium thermophilum]|nr:hypothetical protein [Chloracidobacterium thermophilum]QUV80028.1 hypothetical protein J8C08_14795 [Chloracidobacterium thermophilum]
MSWMKWLTAVLFLFLCLAVNLVKVEPALAQDGGISDSDLPAAIKVLRGEIVALQGELASYVAGLQGGEKARRGKGFEAYRRQFETLGGKISSCRERLQYFHEQVSRLYRTMPTSSLYLAARQAYADAKQDFDTLASNFSSSPRPETLQIAEVRVMDGRLAKHLAQTVPEPAPVKPEQSIGRAFLEADDIRYIGKFDSVEVYLITIRDTAYYVLTGLRERAVEADGRVTEVVRQTILYSDAFPSKQTAGRQTDQHFEAVLQQKFTLLAEDENTTNLVLDELLKARSYARVE